MNRFFIFCIIYFIFGVIQAQEKMPLLWETNLDHTILYIGTGTEDRGYSFAASDKAITILSNESGDIIWSKTFRELAPELKLVDDLICFWESNTIFLFERKPDNDQIACIDISNGELLWNSDKYQDISEDVVVYIPEEYGFAISLIDELIFIKARTGQELWSTPLFTGVIGKYVYNPDNRTMVVVNTLPGDMKNLFLNFENQIAKIDLKNGEIIWENTYYGKTRKKIMTKDHDYDLQINDNKVFLQLSGMQVYDNITGDSDWLSVHNKSYKKLVNEPKGTKKIGIYRVVADPVIDGDYIYILDMSDKESQYITKYNIITGDLIWASEKIEGARAIPSMHVIGDKIGLQIGGKVEAQVFKVDKIGDYLLYEWLRYFPEVKPFGLQVYNSDDGSLAWESEEFKKGITNAISLNNYHIVCNGKTLFSIDINTGEHLFEVPVTDGGVGDGEMILKYQEDIVVLIGKKGISTYNASNGELINTGKYKEAVLEDRVNDIIIMKTEKSDIAAFDLNTCQYKYFKAKTGATTTLSKGGEFVYIYEKKTVSKVKTRE